jgi:uncharacterized protein YbbC (DUF1343 family)
VAIYTPPPLLSNASPIPAKAAVMLGIDVLEADGFAAVKGKRIGLLTHPAGVNRNGVSTIDVLRRAPGVQLVALYGVEHGIYNELPAERTYPDHRDPRTGLMVYSLYNGKSREASAAQLKSIDALVVDLQDIGSRSYTFVSAMKLAMAACFKNGKEIIILDRPNPLGGLKADGPILDRQWMSYVGSFCVPYVHGLTIGELARMAKALPAPLGVEVPDAVRMKGKLTVIPMRGWTRSMRWPETGLTWIPTSPMMPDFSAIQGYPMVGLGTYVSPEEKFDIGFDHGVGKSYPFRGLSHQSFRNMDALEKELRGLNLPGLQFKRVSAPDKDGKPATGIYVIISDYDAWRPTELNFYLMKLACRLGGKNPFAPAPGRQFRGFLRHMGSEEFLRALQRDGANIDLEPWLRRWREQAAAAHQASQKYWLYQ